jgi:tRNA pseudouridine synthase 10
MVYRMRAVYVNPHFFTLSLLAQAGTYIKELVHGDLGRTFPNIGSILDTEADIL